VLELTPRIKFVGHKGGFPKDLILNVYSRERLVGRDTWNWKAGWDAALAGGSIDEKDAA
jgi:hypothetical protein